MNKQASKWLKICGMGVAVMLQLTTTAFVWDFGSSTAILLGVAYVALDLCIWYLISVATDRTVSDGARTVSGVWASLLLLMGMWTVMAGMAVMSYNKITADSDEHVIALKGELDDARSAKANAEAQVAYFQQRQLDNPNKGVMYSKKIEKFQARIESANAHISELNGAVASVRSEVPTGRDVLYKIIKDAHPEADIQRLKLIVMMSFGVLISLTGPLLWAVHSHIKQGAPSPSGGAPGGTKKGAPKSVPRGAPRSGGGGGGGGGGGKLRAVTSMSDERLYKSVREGVISGEVRPTSRALKTAFKIGDSRALPILKRLHSEGVLELKKTSNNTSSYTLSSRYAA